MLTHAVPLTKQGQVGVGKGGLVNGTGRERGQEGGRWWGGGRGGSGADLTKTASCELGLVSIASASE